jgi:hypothetical protein
VNRKVSMGIGFLATAVGNNPAMTAVLAMNPDMPTDQRRLVPLTAGPGFGGAGLRRVYMFQAAVGQRELFLMSVFVEHS